MAEDPNPESIESARQEIDAIDQRMVEMLNRRAKLAQAIGRLKGQDSKPFFTPERERQIYRRLAEINTGPLRTQQLESIFREVISAARAAEKPLSIAFWGPEGTFSHLAAMQVFGASAHYVPVDSISEVFLSVVRGEADYGIVPIENNLGGIVPETLDMFPQTSVKICAESYLPVHHYMLSKAASLADVKRIYAGPQPFAQCRKWIAANAPQAEIIDVVPTAKAAQRALEDPESAAIGNTLVAERLQLGILADRIEDATQNTTRFIVLGFNEPVKTVEDKTSLLFNLKDRPGALYQALGALVKYEVNLYNIESRPAQRAGFERLFYAECGGHRTDDHLVQAIDALKEQALEITVLGSYPATQPNREV